MAIDLVFQGFQSIKSRVHLTLEGLTVVGGESNIGKSAMVRFLHAAFSNKSGTYYISTGEDKALLDWRDPFNHLIWEKHGSAVSYLVNQKKLNKPGRGVVPDEVSRVGICEIRTSDKHRFWPQIQFQGEQPFVISERSPVIAAELLCSSKDLLTVSRALRLVRTDISQDGAKLQILQEQYKMVSARTKLLEGAYTTSAKVYQDLEISYNIQVTSQQRQDTLTGLSNRLDVSHSKEQIFTQVQAIQLPDSPDTKKVQGLINLLDRYVKIQYVLRASKNLVSLSITGDQINDRFKKLSSVYQRSLNLSRRLTCLKTAVSVAVSPKLEIQDLYQRYESLQKLKDRYIQLTRSKTVIENTLIEVNKKLKDVEQESKQLKSLVQELDTCPFCEAPIHEGKYCTNLVA